MILVGFGGGFAAGKTSVCKYLANKHGFVELSFAKALKQLCAQSFNMRDKDRTLLQKIGSNGFKTMKEFNRYMEDQGLYYEEPMFRKWYSMLMNVSQPKDSDLTKAICKGFRALNKNVWVDYLFNVELPRKQKHDNMFCIDDVRFPNEVDACRTHDGLTIYIDVPLEVRTQRYENIYSVGPSKAQINHISEKVDPKLYDVIVNGNRLEITVQDQVERELSKKYGELVNV